MKNNYDSPRILDTFGIFIWVAALLSLFILGCSSKFKAADDLYNKKDYKGAIVEYKALIKEFPNSEWADEVQYLIGRSYFELKNYDASRRAFIALLDDFPNSELIDNAQREIAISFFNDRKYEEAYQELKKFSTEEFKNYPDFQAEAKFFAALCCSNLPGKSNETLDLLNELIEQFPESEWVDNALLSIGNFHLLSRDFEEGLSAYESILKRNLKSDLAVYAKIGIVNSCFGLVEKWNKTNNTNKLDRIQELIIKAIDTCELIVKEHQKATNIISKCSYQIGEAYYKLATEYREGDKIETASENFERALKQYQKTLEDFPTDEIAPYALQSVIWVLSDLGRKDELERFIQKHGSSLSMPIDALSKIDPGLSYFRHALNQEEHYKDYKEALKNYQEAIKKVRNSLIRAQSYYRCGLIYQDKLKPADHKEALEVFKNLISEYDNSENPSVASMVADARIRRSEMLGIPISEEEKHNLIDQKTLGSIVYLVLKNANERTVGYGSGFFVGPGQIATNYHVVEREGRVVAGGHAEIGSAALSVEDNTKYDIQGYTAVDVESDLIILNISARSLSPPVLPLSDSDKVERTNSVYAVGTPLGERELRGTRTPGVISNILKDNTSKRIRFLMTTPVSPGNSGGPVLNDNGAVIGVVAATRPYRDPDLKVNLAQNLNWAIPSNNLKGLIEKTGPLKPLWQLDPSWQVELDASE